MKKKDKKLKLEFTQKEMKALTYWLFLGEVTYQLNKKQSGDKYKVPKEYPEDIEKVRGKINDEVHKQGWCDGKKLNCGGKNCPYK